MTTPFTRFLDWLLGPRAWAVVRFDGVTFAIHESRIDRTTNLYFIRSGGFLKIGLATDLSSRMKTFQLGNPHPIWLEAYRTIPSIVSRHAEADIHALLADFAVGREWFQVETEFATKAAKPVVSRAWRIATKLGFVGAAWDAPDNVVLLRNKNNRL